MLSSVFLLIGNLSGGVFHYLFQVRAAAQLDAPAYGRLNTWLAWVTIALTAANVAQYFSNFSPLAPKRLRTILLATLPIGLAGSAALAFAAPLLGPWSFGLATIAAGSWFLGLLGQAQARTWFLPMGLGLSAMGTIKFVTTFFTPAQWGGAQAAGPEGLYYLAIPLSYAAPLALVSLATLPFTRARHAPAPNRSSATSDWHGAVLIAFAIAIIPQVDLLNLRSFEDDATIGQFSRVNLFAKMIYFGAITLLQVTLPFHIGAHEGRIQPTQYRRVILLERAGLAACAMGSVFFFAVGPWIARRYLGYSLDAERAWILLSCLSLTALYGHLAAIQLDCAVRRVGRAGARIAVLLGFMGLVFVAVRFGYHPGVGTYLSIALATYLGLHAAFRLSRSPA